MTQEFVVFRMRPNPEPDQIAFVFHGHRSVMQAHPNRPKPTDLFEM
jgi:hypothetical protein